LISPSEVHGVIEGTLSNGLSEFINFIDGQFIFIPIAKVLSNPSDYSSDRETTDSPHESLFDPFFLLSVRIVKFRARSIFLAGATRERTLVIIPIICGKDTQFFCRNLEGIFRNCAHCSAAGANVDIGSYRRSTVEKD
jgi:hypothetical protein